MKLSLFILSGLGLAAALASPSTESLKLDLPAAEQLAVANHPRITAAQLKALASRQVVRQVQARYYPVIAANVTAVGIAEDNTRIAAGALSNPNIYDRAAEGITFSHLITDFGRTVNLSESAKEKAKADQENVAATREQIVFEVDSSYYAALQARSLVRVAEQTLRTRQDLFEQVDALGRNKLKSELDVSFARVAVEEAQLLLSQASNGIAAAETSLGALLGFREPRPLDLQDEAVGGVATESISDLIHEALEHRPELARLRHEREAAHQFAKAEAKSMFPTISAFGSGGFIPVRNDALRSEYGAAGVNLNIPLFEGGLDTAKRNEARLRAQAADFALRDQEENVIRDVRLTKLNADYAFDRAALTAKLVENARQSFELARARYEAGAASIAELSQAQLAETSAEIANANARYQYLIQRALLRFQTGATR